MLIASFGVAVLSVVAGYRQGSAALAWVNGATMIVIVAGGVAGYFLAMSSVFAEVADADAARKASILARGISEALNCAAYSAMALLAPALAALVLFVRSSKKG